MKMIASPSLPSTLAGSFSFFFSGRRRHTRLTCDWSSDVCSSDLSHADPEQEGHPAGPGCSGSRLETDSPTAGLAGWIRVVSDGAGTRRRPGGGGAMRAGPSHVCRLKIGRASCRERVENLVAAVAM